MPAIYTVQSQVLHLQHTCSSSHRIGYKSITFDNFFMSVIRKCHRCGKVISIRLLIAAVSLFSFEILDFCLYRSEWYPYRSFIVSSSSPSEKT